MVLPAGTARPARHVAPSLTLWQSLVDIFGLMENGKVGTETFVRSWIYGIICSKLACQIHRLIRKKLGSQAQEKAEAKEVVSKSGSSFTLMAGKPADLSWLSAWGSYVIPLAYFTESFMVLVRGRAAMARPPLERGWRLFFASFMLLPLFECFAEHDWSNPSTVQLREGYQRDHRFRGSLYLWAVTELIVTVSFSRAALDPRRKKIRLPHLVGIALTMGILNGGLGITVAHELLHKPKAVDKAVAHMLLTNVCYLHWADEHLVGHHDKVATPDDPATARRGEPFYAFLPRTVVRSFVSAWRLHARRALTEGKTPSKAAFALQTFGPPLAWVAVLSRIVGCRVRQLLPLWAAQAAFGVMLLEAVNYIEHYGLQRKQMPDGSYEPVNPRHSWNSAHRLSNAILFKLQRHSDHHTFPQRPFQLLRNFEESPQLPTGYFGMVFLSFCPRAFFWIMNPLVDAHNSGGDTKTAERQAVEKFRRWCAFVFVGGVVGPLLVNKRLQR